MSDASNNRFYREPPMTDTADLVKSLRADALWASQGMQIIAERHTSWQAATALSSTQARADKLEAELVEAKRALKLAENISGVWQRKAEAAESSLAAANERLATLRQFAEMVRDGIDELDRDLKPVLPSVPPDARLVVDVTMKALREMRGAADRALKTTAQEG